MVHMMEFKELVDSAVPTTVPGEIGYTVTLMERTHYASREKGREFTGTQNNLWTGPVAAYLSLMGPKGMEEIGNTIMTKSQYAAACLERVEGVRLRFTAPYFKEFVVDFSGTGKSVAATNASLREQNIFGGVDLGRDYPELTGCALFCVTEVNTKQSIDRMAACVRQIVAG